MRIPILKSILRNLDWFEEAQKHHKAPEGTIFVGGINHRLKKEDWSEQKHPRADDGKFTSGSGGGSKKPSKTKRKLERRAEAASQGRVSGAIQTLLSGGSALDKIGWLNTSKPKEPEKKPDSKLKEEAAPAKEPSILDTMAQSWSQSEAMRGKVPTLEHPAQRSAREGAPEGGHSPRVLTQRERDYRDSQNQWDNDRRKMGIPVPGDELATLEIPAKPQQPEKPTADEKPKLPYQELLDQPLPNDTYKLVDLLDKIKDTDERPVKGFEFPKDDPRYTKLKEIRAKIREIDAQTGASARNMAAQQEMDVMEGGREFENPSAYRSWAPPKYRPGPRETKPISTREAPKPTSAPASTNMPESKPVPSAETPKNPNAGNGSPATFEEMFGKSPDHIKVSGSIDHTKPFVLTVEGKTFDHRERLKALGFKYSSANKNWYKGIIPPEGKNAKANLLNHIKEVSSVPGATSQLRAKVQQGKLVPKKRTMSASEASLFGVKR